MVWLFRTIHTLSCCFVGAEFRRSSLCGSRAISPCLTTCSETSNIVRYPQFHLLCDFFKGHTRWHKCFSQFLDCMLLQHDLSVFSPSVRYRNLHIPLCCRSLGKTVYHGLLWTSSEDTLSLPPIDLRGMCNHRETTLAHRHTYFDRIPHEVGNCPSHHCHLTLSESSRQLCPYPATKFRYRAAKKARGPPHVSCGSSGVGNVRNQQLVVFLHLAHQGVVPQFDHRHVADLVTRSGSDASYHGSRN